ncbi:hypothetical protein NDU88_001127 [Pleurodeles waltl]|uniref:Uncharacterized protein n=1 Tax=Pleurodeles waltl TaxID=8319 RepID=A0AAV7WL05_PLEWA|nr:hypothetical protein NDU88_001127 [Pleurodeles waltl]
MCVYPEVEGYAVTQGEEEKTLKETSGVFGENRSTKKEDARPDSGGGTQQKSEGMNRKLRATEKTREAEPSAKDEMRRENANTTRQVPGGPWLLQIQDAQNPVKTGKEV